MEIYNILNKRKISNINPYKFDYSDENKIKEILDAIDEIYNKNDDLLKEVSKLRKKASWYYNISETKRHKNKRCEKGYQYAKELKTTINNLTTINTFLLGLQNYTNETESIDINKLLKNKNISMAKKLGLVPDIEKYQNLNENEKEILVENIEDRINNKIADYEKKYEYILKFQEKIQKECRLITRNIGAIGDPSLGITPITLFKIEKDIKNANKLLETGNKKTFKDKSRAAHFHLVLSDDINELDRIINMMTAFDNITPTNQKYQDIIKFYSEPKFKNANGVKVSAKTLANNEYDKAIASDFLKPGKETEEERIEREKLESSSKEEIETMGDVFFIRTKYYNYNESIVMKYSENEKLNEILEERKEEQLKLLSSTKLECIKTRDDLESFLLDNKKQITISRLDNGNLEFVIENNHNIDEKIDKGYKTKGDIKIFDNELSTKYIYNPNTKDLVSVQYSTQTRALNINYKSEIDKTITKSFNGFLGQIESVVNLDCIKPLHSNIKISATGLGLEATVDKKINDKVSISNTASIKIGEVSLNKSPELGSVSDKIKIKEKITDNATREMTLLDVSTDNFLGLKNPKLGPGTLDLESQEVKYQLDFVTNKKKSIKEILESLSGKKKDILETSKDIHKKYNEIEDILDNNSSNDIFDTLTNTTTKTDKEKLISLNKASIDKALKLDPKVALETLFEVENFDINYFQDVINVIKEPENYIDIISSYTGKERTGVQNIFREKLEERIPNIIKEENAANKYTKILNSKYANNLIDVYNNNFDFQSKMNVLMKENPKLNTAFLTEKNKINNLYKNAYER